MFNLIKEFLKVIRNPPDPNWHIENEAKPKKKYPLGGFWKRSPNHDHGIAIGPSNDGQYFVTFCGPGGCFKKGTYRPNTSIVNDSNYRVIDVDTIEVKGKKRKFNKYVRVKSRETS